MGYAYLVFDVDGTLLDFNKAYAHAQKEIAHRLGVEYSPTYRDLEEKLGWKAWREFSLDDTANEDIQQNYHVYYYEYLHRHFTYLLQGLGRKGDAAELADLYLDSVASSRELMEPDTLAIYEILSRRCRLALATNGVSRVQRPRLGHFLPLASAVFISEEMGVIKPSPPFFEKLLAGLNSRPEECLMVGDSISNDIAGAKEAGMATCWYNPHGKASPKGLAATYTIAELGELLSLACPTI